MCVRGRGYRGPCILCVRVRGHLEEISSLIPRGFVAPGAFTVCAIWPVCFSSWWPSDAAFLAHPWNSIPFRTAALASESQLLRMASSPSSSLSSLPQGKLRWPGGNRAGRRAAAQRARGEPSDSVRHLQPGCPPPSLLCYSLQLGCSCIIACSIG